MHRHHAQYVYDAALLEYNNSFRKSLSTAVHKWWSTVKTFLFDVNRFLHPIRTNDDYK